jgi:hypothetical protein
MIRETEFCNHYRAMSDHKTCEAGVAYDTFQGLKFDERPCFMRDGKICGGCDLQQFPTPEEIAAREAELTKRYIRIGKARAAIVAHLGGPWKKGKPGSSGRIDCPNCESKASLRFSRSGYNGHIHAACTTEGCCSWME